MFNPPKGYSKELAEFFGILLGDGGVEKYFIRIYLNMKADKGYAPNVLKLIQYSLPQIKVSLFLRQKRGTEEIQISSKDACDYLRSIGFDPKNRIVPDWIIKNKEFTKACIRGLFDTEGSIGIKYFNGKNGIYTYQQLTFTNKNVGLLSFIEKGLKKLGFSPTKNSKANIYISNKKDIEKYFNTIGTSNPKLAKKLKINRMST